MLNFAIVSVIGIAFLDSASSYVQNVSMTTAGQWVMHDLRSTLYHHIQRLSLSYHDQSQTGGDADHAADAAKPAALTVDIAGDGHKRRNTPLIRADLR